MSGRIFTIASQVLMITAVFCLGRFNFSYGWLIPFIISTFRDYRSRVREIQQAVTHASFFMNERDVIHSRLDSVPAWVLFPDVERAEWINRILRFFWPMINEMVGKIVKDLETTINQQPMLKSFVFKKIDLGKIVSDKKFSLHNHSSTYSQFRLPG